MFLSEGSKVKATLPQTAMIAGQWLDTNSGHILVALILVVFGMGAFAAGDGDTRTLARDIVMGALGVMWRSMNSGQTAKEKPSEPAKPNP